MPRCYLVKKVTPGPDGVAPRSPTEASIAPTCYSPTERSIGTEPQTDLEKKKIIRNINKIKDDNQKLDTGQSDTATSKSKTADKYTYTSDIESHKIDSHKTFHGSSDELSYELGVEIEHDPYEVAEYVIAEETECKTLDSLPYEVPEETVSEKINKKCCDVETFPKGSHVQPSVEYVAQNHPCISERSAADTEAAHELLSLAQSVPPLPPANVVTVIAQEPPPLFPVYTYTFQPTNIYIVTDDPTEPIYAPIQTVGPVSTVPVVPTIPAVPTVPTIPAVPTVPTIPAVPTVPAVTAVAAVSGLEYVDPQISYVAYQPVEEPQTDYFQATILEPPFAEYTIETSIESTFPDPTIFDEEVERRRLKREAAKYDCDECGKRYATSSNLSRHKQTHRSLDSVEAKRCGECGKAYVSMPALAMHVLTHRKGHMCGLCGKQFSRSWLLRGHLRSHTGEKPYCCGVCGKAFADRSNLRAHLQTHSMDKKYECTHCHKSFALKSYLNKHQDATCIRSMEDE